MPANFSPPPDDLLRFLPETILTVAGTLMMVLDTVFSEKRPKFFGHMTIVAFVLALFASITAYGVAGPAFSNLLIVDGFATYFRILVISIGIFGVLSSYAYLDKEKAETSEYHALMLFSVAGQCLMVAANDLIMIFIGLEISSIASYVLAGYLRHDRRNNEAALKYFLLGSFATGFLLYGVALIYGVAGSTKLSDIHTVLAGPNPSFLMAGIAAALMIVGLAFKVSGAPFQMWAPDVYQGAPAPVSAFLATAPKAAAFAIFLRIFMTGFQQIASSWEPILWAMALLSMTIGNFAALTQKNIKRMLAYSSIAHAGYILVAVTSRSEIGTTAAMFYLAAYALMNIGAFAVVIHVGGKGEAHVRIDDLAGLGRKQPLTAAMLTVFLLSLIGVPLTTGFFGKFYIFRAALESNLVWLAVLEMLNSAVAAYYYLRILVVMYMHEPSEATRALEPMTPGLRAALVLPAIGTFVLGVLPDLVLGFARDSAGLGK